MIYLTRRETFNAAHRLFRPEYSDKKNLEIFGKCSNPNWHGHNYTLYITVKGIPNSETGMRRRSSVYTEEHRMKKQEKK